MKKSLMFTVGVVTGAVVGVAGGCLKKRLTKNNLVPEHEKHILEERIKDGLSTAKNIQAVDKEHVTELDDCIVELTQYLDALREQTEIYDDQFANMWKAVTDEERGIVNAGLFLLLNSDTFDPELRKSMSEIRDAILYDCYQVKDCIKEVPDFKLTSEFNKGIADVEQMLSNKGMEANDLMLACNSLSKLLRMMITTEYLHSVTYKEKKGSLFDAFKDEDEVANNAAAAKTSTAKRSKSKPDNEKKTDEQANSK